MAEAELRNMIMNFRVSDLQVLLGFAGRNKTGKKQELQMRALELMKIKSPAVDMKVRELHTRRYHHQLIARPNSCEMPDRTVSDRSLPHYEPAMNNYSRCNTNVRPTVNQATNQGFSLGKPCMPQMPPQNHLPLSYGPFVDVKFKDLPFYDILHVLMRPCSLSTDPAERYRENNYYFTLSPKQAHEIAVSKDSSGNYECQVLLRFCSLDTSCEQEDSFPPSISVKVNGKSVVLPNPIPTNRPGVEPKRPSKPVNITSYSKLSPTVSNMVNISWASTYGRSYAAGMYVARQLSAQTLLDRLRASGTRNPDHTTAMIKETLQHGQDSDIATTSLRGSLVCPLGKIKMELPCRSILCNHLQCFDASLYIQMNEKKPKWVCPVCDKLALYKTLIIDGLFMDIATKVPPECSEVQFHEDGSWTPVLPKKETKENKKAVEEKVPEKKDSVEVFELSSDSESEMWTYDSVPQSDMPIKADGDLPPSLMYLSPEGPNLGMPEIPTYVPPLAPLGSETCITSALPSEPLDPHCILPDLNVNNSDTSVPSTSSSSPGLGSAHYNAPMPSQYLSEAPAYCVGSNSFQEPLNLLSVNNQNMPSCNGFDLFSLLEVPTVEPQKLRDYEQKSNIQNGTPDVISLD